MLTHCSESSTDVHSKDRQMQGMQSQLNSVKAHLKDANYAREACEQEIQRLKGDLTTMTQENQVACYTYTCTYSLFYLARLFMKNCVMQLRKERH